MKEIQFFVCAIDIYSKCACVVPLEYKKVDAITDEFQKFLHESGRCPQSELSLNTVNNTKYGQLKEVNFTIY